jgi:catechol 2,3-dioxygenase-like lactoylglutathione lyase family enzyme
MLNDYGAIATVAVKDLKKAAAFYEKTLGLKAKSREGDEVISYASGSSLLNVYRSEFAGTNKGTAVCWAVGDQVDAIVESLRSKGVAFEHYELPGVKREGDVHVGHGMRVAGSRIRTGTFSTSSAASGASIAARPDRIGAGGALCFAHVPRSGAARRISS